MQVFLKSLYAPPKLGFMPPPPIRFGRLGTSFPSVAEPQSNMMEGYSPKSMKDGILLGIGGAAIAYFSRYFPGVGEPIGLIGGLGLLGLGTYKFYNVATDAALPDEKLQQIPAGQVPEDVYQLEAKIMTPGNNSIAQLSDNWSSLFGDLSTFKVRFSITNTGPKTVTAQLEFHTKQFTRPLFGKPDIVEFSTNYLIPPLKQNESIIMPGWHPVDISWTHAPVDIVGSLILKASAVDPGKVATTANFTASGS